MHIPYYRQQKPYTCGPAVLRMALAAIGLRRSETRLARLSGTTAKGTSNTGLSRCLKYLGIPYLSGYRMRYRDLQRATRTGPVIIDWAPQEAYPTHPEFSACGHFDPDEDAHYAIIISASEIYVTLQDPVLGRRVRVSRKEFVRSWHDTATSKHWMLVVMQPEHSTL